MKANKRIRDPRRISKHRLFYVKDGVETGVTTFPGTKTAKYPVQQRKR